ncbi:IS3 family transposase [Streptomyces sp. NPDC059176]
MHQARLEIFQRLTYYNTRRRRSALNYLSPAEFQQQRQQGRKLTLAARTPLSTLRGTPQNRSVTGRVGSSLMPLGRVRGSVPLREDRCGWCPCGFAGREWHLMARP